MRQAWRAERLPYGSADDTVSGHPLHLLECRHCVLRVEVVGAGDASDVVVQRREATLQNGDVWPGHARTQRTVDAQHLRRCAVTGAAARVSRTLHSVEEGGLRRELDGEDVLTRAGQGRRR